MLKLNKALLGGGLILLIAFNVYNAINFIFQFFMARMLSISEYGILAALFSISYVFGVFSESIQTVLMKYSASEENGGRLKNLLKKSLRNSLSISFILFILYLVFGALLSKLMNVPYYLIAMTGVLIFFSFLLPVTRGIMLGKGMFRPLSINLLAESLLKLIVGIILVYVGFSIFGAVSATILGVGIAFMLSLTGLKKIFAAKEEKAKTDKIYKYAIPVFFITLVVTLFFSLDTIIAKIIFDEEIAGHYALASILSKTIFWGTLPISKALFPMSAGNAKDDKSKSRNLLFNAIFLLASIILIVLVVFYFFPEKIIGLFSGKTSAEASSILFYLGISMGCLSFANLALLYNLSKGKTRGFVYSLFFVLIEVILLFYFSSSIIHYSLALIAASIIFLIGSLFILGRQNEDFNSNSSL